MKRNISFGVMYETINELIGLVQAVKSETEIVKMMKKMIPEYLGNNSVYEGLD